MLLAILEIYKSGNHFIVNHRQEKGDVTINDHTLSVCHSQGEVVDTVRDYFNAHPEDRLVSVIVMKGMPTYVIKDTMMKGMYLSHNSKIVDYHSLHTVIYDHLDFHTVTTLGDLAA